MGFNETRLPQAASNEEGVLQVEKALAMSSIREGLTSSISLSNRQRSMHMLCSVKQAIMWQCDSLEQSIV